jgi:hypothetical protein
MSYTVTLLNIWTLITKTNTPKNKNTRLSVR